MKLTKKHKGTKVREAINLLNEVAKVRLAPSVIHGVGVVAMRHIKKGEKLYTDIIPHQLDIPYDKLKNLEPEIRQIVLEQFPQVVNGSHFLYPTTKFSAYLNHADTPNYDAKEDKALRSIKAGVEITEDYRLIPGFEKIYPWLVDSQ